MKQNRLLFSALCLFFTMVIGNASGPNDIAGEAVDEATEKPGGRSEGEFSQPLSTAALNSAEAVIIAKLTDANLQNIAKSMPPIYSSRLGLTVEEVLRGEVKVGARLQLRHSANQLHMPEYPVGKRVLVAVKFKGGERAHAIAMVTDEALVKARAALSDSGGSVIDADNSNTAEQDGADQPATAPESKREGKEKPKPEAEGRSR